MKLNVSEEREIELPTGELSNANAKSVVIDAFARAYGVAHRWISNRIGRNVHSPEGEQKLAEEMVDILEVGQKELGPGARALMAHGIYYMEVLALPPPIPTVPDTILHVDEADLENFFQTNDIQPVMWEFPSDGHVDQPGASEEE